MSLIGTRVGRQAYISSNTRFFLDIPIPIWHGTPGASPAGDGTATKDLTQRGGSNTRHRHTSLNQDQQLPLQIPTFRNDKKYLKPQEEGLHSRKSFPTRGKIARTFEKWAKSSFFFVCFPFCLFSHSSHHHGVFLLYISCSLFSHGSTSSSAEDFWVPFFLFLGGVYK